MLSRARRGVCEIVAGAALWRCRCEIVAGAALWRCRCRSRGRRSILCIWVCVCVAGVAFGSCLEGQDVVARAAGGVRNRGRRSTLAMPLRNCGRRSTLAMPLPKSWQAQHSVHLGVCLCGRGRIRQLSRGTGCCRARGGGCAKSWQAQHFGDAVAKSWQAQFGDAVAEVVAGAAFCASGCSVSASIQGAHGTCVWTFGKNIACGVIRSFNFYVSRKRESRSLVTMIRARCVLPVPGSPVSRSDRPARQCATGSATSVQPAALAGGSACMQGGACLPRSGFVVSSWRNLGLPSGYVLWTSPVVCVNVRHDPSCFERINSAAPPLVI